ncbi:MAG: anthranilate phosphoribosyltransferase [Patescibacteria group bacterium]
MTDTRAIIDRAGVETGITEPEAYALQKSVLEGAVATDELVALFTAINGRRISEPELRGFFRASAEAMVAVPDASDSLDTCGTGGDKSGSFNISTASAVLLAAIGIPVAKHGNRAASSKCGSADVLEALGVKIELSPEREKQVLDETGFVFLFARTHHPAFRHAAEARKAFGKRTYFNFLGPLLNPARARFRVHGLSDFSYAEPLAAIVIDFGVEKAFFIHAESGMDEASPFADTEVLLAEKGAEPKRFVLPTSEYAVGKPEELMGGDAAVNAHILATLFDGKGTDAQNLAVALNSALGLVAFGHTEDFDAAVQMSLEALRSGKAARKLDEIVKATNA